MSGYNLIIKSVIVSIRETFKDHLFMDLAKLANETAGILRDGISKAGYAFLTDSPTNQIFPILPNTLIEKLQKLYGFYVWSKVDRQTSSVRLVTSWATKIQAVGVF